MSTLYDEYEENWEIEDEDDLDLEDEDYVDDGFDDYSDDFISEYDIQVSRLSNTILEVEFDYEEDTPLQYVMDEVSSYIEESKLDFYRIHSMRTETDRDGDNLLIVTFTQ